MPARFIQLIPRAVVCVAALLLSMWVGSGACAQAMSEDRVGAAPEGASGSAASVISYSQAEQALFAQAEAGTLGSADLFAASLVASGVQELQEQRFYDARLRQLTQRLQSRAREAGDRV